MQCLLNEEMRRRASETYIAEHLWLLTGAVYSLGGQTLGTPRYSDLFCMTVPTVQPQENLAQVKGRILQKLVVSK